MRLDPKDVYAFQNVADAYERLNRFDEARAVAERAAAQNMGRSVHFTLFDLAFIRGDEAAERHEVELAGGKPDEPILLMFQANAQCALGKLQSARAAYAQSEKASQRLGYKEFSGGVLAEQASCEAELGNVKEARQKISEALAVSQDRDTRATVMVVLPRTGDTTLSKKIAEGLVREYPTDTLLNKVFVPVAQARSDLQGNQPEPAVARLEIAIPYELGTLPNTAGYWVNYIRGEAFLGSSQGAKAAAEYLRILDHRGIDPWNVTYTLSHLGLGRAYALQGNRAAAKSAYQDFFAAWKDADPDLPVLKQAKLEYEKLK